MHPEATVHPSVEINEGVTIDSGAEVSGVKIGERATIGRDARLNPGVEIGSETATGDKVEIAEETVIGRDCGIHHLATSLDPTVGFASKYDWVPRRGNWKPLLDRFSLQQARSRALQQLCSRMLHPSS